MKVKVTLREILNSGSWEEFCSDNGYNEWCINEGLASGDEEVEITTDEAFAYGLLTKEQS